MHESTEIPQNLPDSPPESPHNPVMVAAMLRAINRAWQRLEILEMIADNFAAHIAGEASHDEAILLDSYASYKFNNNDEEIEV